MPSEKRQGMPVEGIDPKRAKINATDELVAPSPPAIQLPPAIETLENFVPPAIEVEPNPDSDDETLTPSQRAEIRKVRRLLKQAYIDAPIAMENPNFHLLATINWSEATYNPGRKSLAYLLHVEEGWTEAGMLKHIGGSPSHFRIYPLPRPQSFALHAAIRHRCQLNEALNHASFGIDVPEDWLYIKLKFKEFGKKGGTDYAKKLVATVAYNQPKFLGKGDHWFRPRCEELGWAISESFFKISLISLFVICVNPELLEKSAETITGSWGGPNRSKFKLAWTNAVQAAIKKDEVMYPSTLALLKNLHPALLK